MFCNGSSQENNVQMVSTNKQIKHFLFLLFPEKNREMETQESPWVSLGGFVVNEWRVRSASQFPVDKTYTAAPYMTRHKGSEEHAFLLIIPPNSAEISLSDFTAIFCDELRSLCWVFYDIHKCE